MKKVLAIILGTCLLLGACSKDSKDANTPATVSTDEPQVEQPSQ